MQFVRTGPLASFGHSFTRPCRHLSRSSGGRARTSRCPRRTRPAGVRKHERVARRVVLRSAQLADSIAAPTRLTREPADVTHRRELDQRRTHVPLRSRTQSLEERVTMPRPQ